MMRRRTLLGRTGAALASAAMPVLISKPSASSARPNTQTLHTDIELHVERLANSRKVSLRILLPNGSSANVGPIAARFSTATGVPIEIEETSVDEINTHLLIETLSDGSRYDVALPATFGVPDLVSAGALLNLDEYAARYEPEGYRDDALFSLGDYHKGKLYGYQTDGDVYLMFYNKSFIENSDATKRYSDRYGRELKIPDTWEELDFQLSFFHDPDSNKFGGALFRTPTYIAWEFWARFHAKGLWPFNEELRPQINSQAGVEALEELVAASRHLHPNVHTNGLFENWKAYANGNIYCNIGWGGTQKYLNQATSGVKGKLAYASTPGGYIDGKKLDVPYFNWGWNYAITSSTPEPEIAYLFALYACSPEMSTIAVRESSGFFDPFRSAHYEDPQIQRTYSMDFLEAHRESMAKSIPDLYLTGQGEYFDALRHNLVRANEGSLTPKRALDLTAQEWERTTRRIGRSSQIEQWQFLRQSYPANVRQILK